MLMLMNTIRMVTNRLTPVRDDETGGVAIEYALLAGLIALGIAVAAALLATNISTFFNMIGTWLSGLSLPGGGT